jgi:hypothetical protein
MSRMNQNAGSAAGLILVLLSAANLVLGSFNPAPAERELIRLAAAFSVLPILIALSLTDRLISSFFPWKPSGRSIAHELQVRKIPSDRLAVQGMNRGLHYSLNFYLHDEIEDWNPDHPTAGYVLAGMGSCRYVVPPTFSCEEVPFDLESTGRFLFRVAPSASLDGVPRRGQSQ